MVGDLAAKLRELTKPVEEMDQGLLASASYDGDKRLALLKFYDQKAGRFWLWQDNTGHRPYCYSRLSMDELKAVHSRKDVIDIIEEVKLDLLNDTKARLRKIITTDPLAIGGGNDSIRDMIRAWEADIKYYENYTYDLGLRMGTYYKVTGGKVIPVKHPVPDRVGRSLEQVTQRNPAEFQPYLKEWAELLGEPLCDFRRIALDIEVANEAGRLPDTDSPDQKVIAVSFFNDQEKLVYLLRAGKETRELEGRPFAYQVFDNEEDLLRAVLSKIMDYPVIVTFNGDDFDLRYLQHRAERLGIKEEENPIQLERVAASLKHGIHIDLYQFFRNKSIQVYAFSNKYSERTLNGISESLLNKSKIEFEGEIGDIPLQKLAEYCLNDSQLTYELTSLSGSVVMKLLLVISRIGKMPMNDVSRLGVSNWIRSMLFFEHRKIGALIPRQDELSEKGGASSKAIIKGKKYKGGFVIEPKPGVYFDVSVLDFASLYPSLIKVDNLSYETVNCPHPECRTNTIPDTSSWVCTKRKGIVSLVTGSLRDLRVAHYKPLTKDASLSKEDRELYNVVTQGLKVFLNASYGVLGFETFAFYCLPVAEATAALGRDAITRTIAKCKELGIEVLYGDSVTGDRCVTLLDPDEHLRVMPIEEFYGIVTERNVRADGKEERHPADWRALSVNPMTGRVEFKHVKAVVRHRNSKRIFRVREKWGVTRVTEDHSLLVADDASRRFSGPLEIDGGHLVRASEIPYLAKINEIDVYEVMKDLRYPTLYKGRIRIIQAHADDEWVWFGWTNRKFRIKVKRHIRVGTSEFKALVELLGAYIPEGSSSTPDTTKSKLGASISNADTSWLNQLRESYFSLFNGAKASAIRSTKGERLLSYPTTKGRAQVTYVDKTYKLQMMNKLAAAFFKAFAGQGSKGKKVPDFIYHVPAEYQKILLDNMVKGDGSRKFGQRYTPEYAARNFRYETGSTQLASGLSTLLTIMGVKHTINYRASKGTYGISTSGEYNRRQSTPRVTEEPYDGYVYDLSVEDYHTFVDSCGSVVLKNTDSLFLRSPSKEQISTVTRWADKDLGVELDLDKVYRYVAFSSRKKNYFGVLPDGTADIRGLTGKKSVDGSTPILIRSDGVQKLVLVRDAYNDFVAGHKVEVISVTDDLRSVWVPISDATRHEVDNVYLVKTSKGRLLKLSGDHSVYTMDSFGNLSSKPTKLMAQGDVLVGARFIPPKSGAQLIDVQGFLSSATRTKDGSLHSAKAHSTTGIPMPKTLPLNPDLAQLLGIYTAEGSSSSNKEQRNNVISQDYMTNPEVCRAISDSWEATFGWKPHVIVRRGSTYWNFYLPVLHNEFFRNICGKDGDAKRVPPFIFEASREILRGYLRGLFSGDGYPNSKRINIASSSHKLIVQVAYLLSHFDIDCRIRRQYNPKYRRYYYWLSVIDSSSRRRFILEIGFLQTRFNGIPSVRPGNKELLPLTTVGLLSIKSAILARLGKSSIRNLEFHDQRRYNMMLVDRYNSVISLLESHAIPSEKTNLERISRMLNSQDVTYDEVISVKHLPGKCVMYDFSVPGLERFVAGNLPTLLHNSQTPEYLKKVFYETLDILSQVKTPEDFERARKNTRDLLTGMISNLKGKKVPVQDLAFTVMMGKPTDKYNGTTPQHVRAAMQLEEKGKEIKAGEIIAYVKTKNPPYVKPAELARPDEIDSDKYIEYAHSMFDQMLDALDFSFDEIMGATTLDLFWSG
jgi:DNA polymerase, archaea type